jgi:type III restriction enzyme
MSLPLQIKRYMSLRDPQYEALEVLDEISAGSDYKTASLETTANAASKKSRTAKPVKFDTEFPSFCFALATGVGKTRLMGGCIYYLWKSKGYRHFFILAPNITIYEKLRAELSPSHPKYMFIGLSDFPVPDVFDGDNYLRFRPEAGLFDENQCRVFIFNISKIFTARTDTEFKFHRFNEYLGNSFSAILQEMDDLVVLMDESHRYRGEASLNAINHLKPVVGLEFTATPKYKHNVIYSFNLAQSIGRYIKTPTVVTRTNLTTSDAEEIERLKLLDGMARHELKKGRLIEYCQANDLPLVKPFVLISTRDTNHAPASSCRKTGAGAVGVIRARSSRFTPARGELEPSIDTEVKEQALAAIRWCQIASTVKNGLKWEYKLIPDDVIKPTHDFKFILGNACSLTVE